MRVVLDIHQIRVRMIALSKSVIVHNIHTIIYIKNNYILKRNNNNDKINKLSKNMLTIYRLSCIIKIH